MDLESSAALDALALPVGDVVKDDAADDLQRMSAIRKACRDAAVDSRIAEVLVVQGHSVDVSTRILSAYLSLLSVAGAEASIEAAIASVVG